jgi:hypothetical protein
VQIKILFFIGIIIALIVISLIIKNRNNPKSAFYIPKEYSLSKKCLGALGCVIITALGILFLFNNRLGNPDW